MDEEIARHVIRTNFRCSRELQNLLMLLKKQMPDGEFQIHAKAIAMVLAEMGQALSNPALAAHPSLAQEVEASLSKYGEYL